MKLGRVNIFESAHVRGRKFGTKGSIHNKEWEVIANAIVKYNIKNVLEFGSGFSTKLFFDAGLKVTSMETNENWAKVVRKEVPHAKIIVWDNKEFPDYVNGYYDLSLVDGAWPRIEQLKQAMQRSNRLFIHDVNRQDELDLIQGHLTGWKAYNWQNNPEFTKERLAFFEKSV